MSKLRNIGPRLSVAPTAIAAVPRKTAAAHYLTPEHRAWRAEIIQRAGHRCEKCRRGGMLYADHIAELSDGGDPLALSNGQALCAICHSSKTAAARAARMALPT